MADTGSTYRRNRHIHPCFDPFHNHRIVATAVAAADTDFDTADIVAAAFDIAAAGPAAYHNPHSCSG